MQYKATKTYKVKSRSQVLKAKNVSVEESGPVKYMKVGTTYVAEDAFNVLQACVETSQPALLVGETGTGKTSLVRELADVHGKELIRVSLNGTTGIEEILGKWLAKDGNTVWNDGILISAMKLGHWIIFDEINAALPEILFALHSLLDDDRKVLITEKDNEVVLPHDEFRFFASMNPPEDYAGTKDVNRALMSRFQAIIKVEPMPNHVEFQVIKDQTGIDDTFATQLVQLGQTLRESKANGDIFYFCSTRDLLHAARLVKAGCSVEHSVQYAIVNKMSRDEEKQVESVLKSILSLKPGQIRTVSMMLTEIDNLTEQLRKEKAESIKFKNHSDIFEATAKEQSARADVLAKDVIAVTKKLEVYQSAAMKAMLERVEGAIVGVDEAAVPAATLETA